MPFGRRKTKKEKEEEEEEEWKEKVEEARATAADIEKWSTHLLEPVAEFRKLDAPNINKWTDHLLAPLDEFKRLNEAKKTLCTEVRRLEDLHSKASDKLEAVQSAYDKAEEKHDLDLEKAEAKDIRIKGVLKNERLKRLAAEAEIEKLKRTIQSLNAEIVGMRKKYGDKNFPVVELELDDKEDSDEDMAAEISALFLL